MPFASCAFNCSTVGNSELDLSIANGVRSATAQRDRPWRLDDCRENRRSKVGRESGGSKLGKIGLDLVDLDAHQTAVDLKVHGVNHGRSAGRLPSSPLSGAGIVGRPFIIRLVVSARSVSDVSTASALPAEKAAKARTTSAVRGRRTSFRIDHVLRRAPS